MGETLSVKALTRRFGPVTALDGVDLELKGGEMFALVGPDGAGKTTLLRILAAVLPHDEGEVRVLGHQLPEHRRSVKPKIGYLSQGFSLYGDLSIDENLAFFAEIYGLEHYRQRRDELLAFTRLEPFRDRLAGRLSGGMKKKLALACALIHRPQLILLDEPTTGVDPVSRRDFWVILGELLHEGLTIVVATPYLDEAERCGRVGLLDRGRFLTVGRPQEVKKEMKGSMYEVVTSRPRAARALLQERGFPGLLEMQAQGDRIHLRLASTAPEKGAGDRRERLGDEEDGRERLSEEIRRLFEEAGVPAESVRQTTPTLENLFISLISEERR
jgi:ABC-2 type transport system ATP-binding protein